MDQNTSKFNKDFIKNCNKESDKRYFLEIDVQYTEKLHELYHDLLCSPERIKIEKIKKLLANLHDKTEYVMHIRNLKPVLNNGLAFRKVYRVIKYN